MEVLVRVRYLSLALIAAAFGVAVTSCGSSSSGSGSGAGDCTSVATAACNNLEKCSPLAISRVYGDVQTCVQRATLGCKNATSGPGASVTPAEYGACASGYSSLSCTDLVAALNGALIPAGCDLNGSRADGEACAGGAQCTSGYCKLTAPTGCGTCAKREAAGTSCIANAQCQIGLVCSSSGVCAEPVEAGGHCAGRADCAFGLACRAGTCAKPAEAGASCDPAAQDCDSVAGLYCSASGTCTLVKVAKPGEACGLVSGTLVGCEAGGHCTASASQPQGTCQAPAADGAACDSLNGPTCQTPAECTNGTCKVPDAASCG